jgi:hypothetical protein
MALPDPLADGSLPAFVFPGGYPILYLAADGGIFCPACANGQNGSLAHRGPAPDGIEDGQWQLVDAMLHMEGGPESCDHCGADIESAYGPAGIDLENPAGRLDN